VSGDRGLCFLPAARERRPLGELPGGYTGQIATPSTATPDAGPLHPAGSAWLQGHASVIEQGCALVESFVVCGRGWLGVPSYRITAFSLSRSARAVHAGGLWPSSNLDSCAAP